jgi:hypothetical protein
MYIDLPNNQHLKISEKQLRAVGYNIGLGFVGALIFASACFALGFFFFRILSGV